ncbi:MAG: BON domain-containing protein [Planctomycetia bacterium]|nr:BON domain-containing protein [Planctomycetia bacterium]
MRDAPMQQCPGQPYTVQQCTVRPCTQNSSGNFPAAEAGELDVQDRKRLAATRAFDSVSVESVGRALCATGYPALRDIQIEVERGIVVLWGRVPTYHQKQVAQVTAQGVAGVRGIANGIEVVCDR